MRDVAETAAPGPADSSLRVVMFVYNDCRTDARVLREATTLAAAGYRVTVVGRPSDLASTEVERETRGPIMILRVPVPRPELGWLGWLRRPWRIKNWIIPRLKRPLRNFPFGLVEAAAAAGLAIVALPFVVLLVPLALLARRPIPPGGTVEWIIRWRLRIGAWARLAADLAPPADVYHAHDLTALPAGVRAARANRATLVYDSHEIFLESGANANRPRPLRAVVALDERRWVRRAAAVVTVNDALAAELERRYRPRRTVVVHNCPPRWQPPAERPDRIRAATGIPADAPIALYHGGFSAHRGLEELAEAILQPGLERVHAVYLGYGSLRPALDELARDPRFAGRLHVLDAVPPDELIEWVASADVGVMAIAPSTLNHRLSTPNKLFECLAAGTPVVVSDLPEMRRIVLGDPVGPLGEVCAPGDPVDLARAIRAILERPPEELAALRARCLRAAHERWNWERESAALLELYAELATARAQVHGVRVAPVGGGGG